MRMRSGCDSASIRGLLERTSTGLFVGATEFNPPKPPQHQLVRGADLHGAFFAALTTELMSGAT